MPTYEDCVELAQTIDEKIENLQQLKEFILARGVRLPDLPYVSLYSSVNVWLTETEGYQDEEGQWQSKVNEVQTKENTRKFLDAVGECEKQYSGDTLTITKKFGKLELQGCLNREQVCKKIVKKREFVPHTTEGYWKEDVEWDCDTPSLKEYVNS